MTEVIKTLWRRILPSSNENSSGTDNLPVVALVGAPNVGKSALFNKLTGRYVTVSNYPGTTVEITTGSCSIGNNRYNIIDTPGMYSLLPITEEERVARELLIETHPELVINVVDAKNLTRMLTLTLQLLESGFPVILALNMMDELDASGIEINIPELHKLLGVPIVPTSCLRGDGIAELKEMISAYCCSS